MKTSKKLRQLFNIIQIAPGTSILSKTSLGMRMVPRQECHQHKPQLGYAMTHGRKTLGVTINRECYPRSLINDLTEMKIPMHASLGVSIQSGASSEQWVYGTYCPIFPTTSPVEVPHRWDQGHQFCLQEGLCGVCHPDGVVVIHTVVARNVDSLNVCGSWVQLSKLGCTSIWSTISSQEKQLMVCVSFWRNFPMFNGIWTSTELKWRPSPCNPLCANHHTVIIPDTDPTKVPYFISYRLQGNRIIHHFLSWSTVYGWQQELTMKELFKQMFIPMGMLNKWFITGIAGTWSKTIPGNRVTKIQVAMANIVVTRFGSNWALKMIMVNRLGDDKL